jgi:hypothetical protein
MGSNAWIWLRPTLDHWGTILPTGKAEETEAMPDVRPIHRHAATLYGSRGPQQILGNELPHDRPLTTQMRWKAPVPVPESIQAHVETALSHVRGLSPSQRNSVVAAMVTLCRDISFLKQVHDQVGWAPRDHSGGTLPVG